MATIESIDKLFAECDDASAALSGKLLGVQNDIQYKAVTGTGGFEDPKLTGESKKVVDGAKSIISGIWIVVNVITTRIDAVRAKRGTVKTGILGTFSGTIGEISELLTTTPLDFSKEASKLPDVLRLQLLPRGQTTVSLADAIAVGTSLLHQGAQSIIDVNASLNALKQHIAEVEKRLVEVEPIVLKVGGSAQYAHKSATANLATLKGLYETDPLGVTRSFQSQVDQHINTINGAIDGVQKAKEKAYASYGDAQVLMQRLDDRQPTPDRAPALRDWLNKLVKRLEQEDWAAASSGLDDWIKDASGVLNGRSSGQSSGQSSGPAPVQSHPQPPHGQPPAQRPQQPVYAPPPRQAPPPPVRVEQLPVSGDYQKYAPPGKSDLQKLLDGELKPARTSAPAPVEKPADAAVTDLVQSRPANPTPPQSPQTSVATSNTALDTLVNGPKKPASTNPGAQTGQSPPENNQALGDLISGRKPKPPVQSPVQPPLQAPVQPPVQPSAKPSVSQAPPVPASSPSTPASTSDQSAKLTELFTGKRSGTPASNPAPAASPAAAKAPTQAEQDEAARKALEKLLKR